MNIEKYLKNKDIKISNDDFDIECLTKDLRKGYIEEKEAQTKIKDEISTKIKENNKEYAQLESKYNELEKRNAELTSKNQTLSLERVMVEQGFKEDQFKEISTLRYSLYPDEKDDTTAIKNLAQRFASTYFPEKQPKIPEIPNEVSIKGHEDKQIANEIKITRNTKISDLFVNNK